jgi:hypothetical protein
MTVQTVEMIKDRISIATEESPVAVFSIYEQGFKKLDAVFASTVQTQKRIKMSCSDLVGVFHQDSENISKKLRKALNV